ncbi:MAG TPA: hypothetical protein VG271_16950, partial [Beijerinckiaceae bacterium]|nr:hypothetical protein [Beijerinckiaceae bacterium]
MPDGEARASRTDLAHLSLLLGALALSYLLPFELLIISYAVLGPAHYLTEISWLHDRKYFLPHRGLGLLLCFIALGAMFMADSFWLGVLISFTFVVCAILAITHKRAQALVLLAVATASFAILSALHVPFGLAWALVPSVIHVSVFTLVFMTLGAYRSRSAVQSVFVGIYLAAAGDSVTARGYSPKISLALATMAGDAFKILATAFSASAGPTGWTGRFSFFAWARKAGS